MRLQAQVQSLIEIRDERDTLQLQVVDLETARAQLASSAQQASAAKEDVLARIGALQGEKETVLAAAGREKAGLQAQHRDEVEGMRKGLADLEVLKEMVGRLEEQNQQLAPHVDMCSQLEERVKSLGVQLEAEQTTKKVSSGSVSTGFTPSLPFVEVV